jgi:sporulation protein YlmC with PRC-barrel domain
MKRSLKNLIGFSIGASDGEIGTVKEFYFDDDTWTIRYLVVETGGWLFGRNVLISPTALLTPDWENQIFPVSLTMEQVKNSPAIDTEKPVSRQQELELYAYYPWGSYWGAGFYAGGMPLPASIINPVPSNPNSENKNETQGDQHLRSTDHVTGYNIHTTDGEIGKVEDFLIDDKNWKIHFMVVEVGSWLAGKKVLIAPRWIKELKWATAEVLVHASIQHIKNSPEFDATHPLKDEYEIKLYKYYDGLMSHVM